MAVSVDKVGKTWRVRVSWYVDGKRHWKTKQGFRTKSDAKAYGVELEQKQLTGVDISDNTSFKNYFNQWYNTYIANHIRDVTKTGYKYTYKYITDYFNNKALNKITRQDYQNFINNLGKQYSKGTVKRVQNHCRACIKSAVLDKIVNTDFTQNVKISYDESKSIKVDYLNLDEIKRLLNYSIEHRTPLKPQQYLIFSAIYTGARISELCGLTWDDLHQNYIDINKSYGSISHKIEKTKNESSIRTVAIPTKMYNYLQELKDNGSDFIFYNSNTSDVVNNRSANRQLQMDLQALGIQRQGFHFHSLRHSHVAYLLSLGIDLYAISKRLGHSDTATTSRVYAYLLDEHKKKIDDTIVDGLNKI